MEAQDVEKKKKTKEAQGVQFNETRQLDLAQNCGAWMTLEQILELKTS